MAGIYFFNFASCEPLRGRAVYAYVFKKNVDGQGTQAIIKNLNLKKLKRF